MLVVGKKARSIYNCTFRQAWGLAAEIKINSARVKNIIIIGDIARDLIGGAFNFLILVDEDDFQKFINTLERGQTDLADRRANVAEILQFNEPFDLVFVRNADLDVWLFPTDWSARVEKVENLLPEDDRTLSGNINRGQRQPLN